MMRVNIDILFLQRHQISLFAKILVKISSSDWWIYNFRYRIFENENERRGEERVYLDATRREMCPRIEWRRGFEKQRNRVVFVQIRLIGKYLHEKGGAQANLSDGTK